MSNVSRTPSSSTWGLARPGTGARIWATALAEKGRFRDGVDLDTATDLLWLAMAPDQYHRLVRVRDWSDGRFQRRLVDSLTSLLLPPQPTD